MKVLLVHTTYRKGASLSEPHGLTCLGAYLEQHGVDVRICDESFQDTDRMVKEFSPDYLGISAVTPSVDRAYELADKYRGKIKTIIGGIHASIFPEETLTHADYVVVGEGETALLKIVNGCPKGIVIGEMIADLDTLPLPARHLIDIKHYSTEMATRWHFGQGHKTTSMMTSRGCPFRCVFCWNSTRKAPVRYRSVDNVVKEIEQIMGYGIKSFYMIDDDFFLPHKRFFEIADRVKDYGLRMSIFTRSTSINEKVLETYKAIGGEWVSIGFESGSQKILNSMKKCSTVDINQNAVDLCRKYGMTVSGWLMVGNPGETPEDLELTKQFMLKNPLEHMTINMNVAFPGTTQWDYCKEHNLIPEGFKWGDYNITEGGPGWTPNASMPYSEVKKWFDELHQLADKKTEAVSILTAMRIFIYDPVAVISQLWRVRRKLTRLLRRIKWF